VVILYPLNMTEGGIGYTDRDLTQNELESLCADAFGSWDLDGKRVLVLIPDHTRTCPLDRVFPLLYKHVADKAASLNILVALGTHPALEEQRILDLVGITEDERKKTYPKAVFHNHLWKDPAHLTQVGLLDSAQIGSVTDGLFEMDLPITCNKMVTENDVIIILGPVFPHEVVGFSGGNKYIMPGIAGQEIIDFFHWLGAVITNPVIIGNKWTPVRKVLDMAASLVPCERLAMCMVVKGDGLAGMYYGPVEKAWSSAADLSGQVHIEERDAAYHTILSCAPKMYDDLWTGGKCMYKIEPIVADGGRVIIYAPHITEISPVHGAVLEEIGYHTRDFFLAQWDKYKGYPWGVVAHSTHVKGVGTYEDGVEKPRVEVILATGIPRDMCDKINLGYMDPAEINVDDYSGREEEGVLCVRKAGEILYRSRNLEFGVR
jgi:nickel-dependent lactate racemase